MIIETPKEFTPGFPVLTILGQIELSIENYNGLLEYTSECIRVRVKTGIIIITGERLFIDYYMNDEMKIRGRIIKIEYD